MAGKAETRGTKSDGFFIEIACILSRDYV
jgi:hypothetical protein